MELKDFCCTDITDDKGNNGHNRTGDETVQNEHCTIFGGLNLGYQFHTAFHPCAEEEEHQTEFAEYLDHLRRNTEIQLTEMTEVTADQSNDQGTAGIAEREACAVKTVAGERDFDRAEQDTEDNCDAERSKAEFIKQFMFFFCLCSGCSAFGLRDFERFTFLGDVCLENFRHDLDEQNYTDNTERICDRLPEGNETSLTGCFRNLFCGGECRSGGQCAGEDTGAECRADPGDERKENSGECTGYNNDRTKRNIGFYIFLEVPEKVRTSNKTNCRNEENKTDITKETISAHDCVGGLADVELGEKRNVFKTGKGTEITEQQRNQEHTGGTER